MLVLKHTLKILCFEVSFPAKLRNKSLNNTLKDIYWTYVKCTAGKITNIEQKLYFNESVFILLKYKEWRFENTKKYNERGISYVNSDLCRFDVSKE